MTSRYTAGRHLSERRFPAAVVDGVWDVDKAEVDGSGLMSNMEKNEPGWMCFGMRDEQDYQPSAYGPRHCDFQNHPSSASLSLTFGRHRSGGSRSLQQQAVPSRLARRLSAQGQRRYCSNSVSRAAIPVHQRDQSRLPCLKVVCAQHYSLYTQYSRIT